MRDFEIDPRVYPYAAQRYGDNWFAVHVPTQFKVWDQPLPPQVAREFCEGVNKQHHSLWDAHLVPVLLGHPHAMYNALVKVAHRLRSSGAIGHEQYLAVQLQVPPHG